MVFFFPSSLKPIRIRSKKAPYMWVYFSWYIAKLFRSICNKSKNCKFADIDVEIEDLSEDMQQKKRKRDPKKKKYVFFRFYLYVIIVPPFPLPNSFIITWNLSHPGLGSAGQNEEALMEHGWWSSRHFTGLTLCSNKSRKALEVEGRAATYKKLAAEQIDNYTRPGIGSSSMSPKHQFSKQSLS